MAIVAREAVADPSWEIVIRAVDLNPAVLEKAARARYSSWALRDTSPDVQRKWFRADGRELVLEDSVRAAVKFDSGNLASDDPALWPPATYDAIFCRNVLMYFTPAQAANAARNLRCALVDDDLLKQVNCTSSVVIATAVNFSYVVPGQRIATVKSAPFAVAKRGYPTALNDGVLVPWGSRLAQPGPHPHP